MDAIKLMERYPGFDEFVLVKEEDGYCLFGYGEYEESSVLAGQFRRARLEFYDAEEQAKKDTGLNVSESAAYVCARVPDCPPEGWDPMDAGEVWGEDDY